MLVLADATVLLRPSLFRTNNARSSVGYYFGRLYLVGGATNCIGTYRDQILIH